MTTMPEGPVHLLLHGGIILQGLCSITTLVSGYNYVIVWKTVMWIYNNCMDSQIMSYILVLHFYSNRTWCLCDSFVT